MPGACCTLCRRLFAKTTLTCWEHTPSLLVVADGDPLRCVAIGEQQPGDFTDGPHAK